MSRNAMITPISDWLVESSLIDSDVVQLFGDLCNRMAAVGIPIARARLVWPTLHPLFQAETVSWDRGVEASLEQFEHQDKQSDAWVLSPLAYLVENRLDTIRRELDGPNELLDFPILKELKEQGYTDYLLLGTRLEGKGLSKGKEGGSNGVMVTWSSDKPGGFSEEDLWSLQKIQKRLAVACKTIIQSRVSNNITETYLGARAGTNVMDGQIRRGDGQTIDAVVWYSDLRNSTSLAESMKPDDYFSLLNTFFMSTAQPVDDHGGEILDFIGDAVLGIFPFDGEAGKCKAASSANYAIETALKTAEESNLRRLDEGVEQFKYGIGLNVGEVMFGNIGIPSRLAFSVIGPTVNQAARIENMTKLLQQPVLADSGFANLSSENWKSMGEHKLDGVLEPLELFAYAS